jgi:hypothetical protein
MSPMMIPKMTAGSSPRGNGLTRCVLPPDAISCLGAFQPPAAGACQSASKFDPRLECALDGGQFQAAFLTGCWAWRSSYCAGLI